MCSGNRPRPGQLFSVAYSTSFLYWMPSGTFPSVSTLRMLQGIQNQVPAHWNPSCPYQIIKKYIKKKLHFWKKMNFWRKKWFFKEFWKVDTFVPTWSWPKFLVSSATYCSRSVHFRGFLSKWNHIDRMYPGVKWDIKKVLKTEIWKTLFYWTPK